MTFREHLGHFVAHIAPLILVKQVFHGHIPSQAFSHSTHDVKPWMNVDKVELTAEDFA